MTLQSHTSETALAVPTRDTVDVIVEPAATPTVSPPQPPFRSLADLIAEVILRGRSEQTRRAYRVDLQDFLVWWLKQNITLPTDPEVLRTHPQHIARVQAALGRVQQVTEADINAYILHLREGNLATATIRRRLTPLRLLYDRLLRHHQIAINPLEDIRSPKVSNQSTTVYLSREQARTLEDHCKGPTLRDLRDRALIVFMLSTGLRAFEVVAVDIEHFAEIDGHHVVWIMGKGDQRARVKLKPRTWQVLKRYLTALRAANVVSGPVFRRLRQKGRDPHNPNAPQTYNVHGRLSYQGLKYILQGRFIDAGLHLLLPNDDQVTEAMATDDAAQHARDQQPQVKTKASPHSLRHSFVTLALKGGAPLPKVQAAARHADPRTTMRYAHDQDELEDNAVDYVSW